VDEVTLDARRVADLGTLFTAAELRSLVSETIAGTTALLETVARVGADASPDEVAAAAHRGRNEALAFGARELGEAFAALERAANGGDDRSAVSAVERLNAIWPATRAAIERLSPEL
jgi:hypothetical protein